jgi:hypothetical protein
LRLGLGRGFLCLLNTLLLLAAAVVVTIGLAVAVVAVI